MNDNQIRRRFRTMKNLILAIVCIALTAALAADTIIPGGPVSGSWLAAGSPYQVTGNISIASEAFLIISPGVEVIFNGTYKLDVAGRIECQGELQNPVIFTATDTTNGWQGIRFTNTGTGPNLPSVFYWTEFLYGKAMHGATGMDPLNFGGAVWADNGGVLTFNNCTFRRCMSSQDGSAIYAKNGTAIHLNGCSVKNCDSNFWGGLFVKDGSVNVQNCTFLNNNADTFGGALYIYNCNPAAVTSCNIIGNTAGACAGIYSYGSPLAVSNSLFKGNSCVTGFGAGMGVIAGSLSVTNCTFAGNFSPMGGGGFWLNVVPAPVQVTNSIFWSNLPGAIYPASSTYNLSHCSMQIQEGDATNIFGDPLFVSYGLGDLNLQPESPCVDAGTPDTAGLNLPATDLNGVPRILDGNGDGTARIDMGCYEWQPPVPSGLLTGFVTDGQGQPLAGALITADAESVVTDAAGAYTMVLNPGSYSVSCALTGFESVSVNVEIFAGQTTYLNFDLNPVANDDPLAVPLNARLEANPNPFRIGTALSFSLAKPEQVTALIYNLKGQKIRTLASNWMDKGTHSLGWDGKDDSRRDTGSGIYLVKLSLGERILTRRIMKL